MSVVDNGHDLAIGTGILLHASRHPGPLQALLHAVVWDAIMLCHSNRRQGIGDVEKTRYSQDVLSLLPEDTRLKMGLPSQLLHPITVDISHLVGL